MHLEQPGLRRLRLAGDDAAYGCGFGSAAARRRPRHRGRRGQLPPPAGASVAVSVGIVGGAGCRLLRLRGGRRRGERVPGRGLGVELQPIATIGGRQR